jgi:hypothetical protein
MNDEIAHHLAGPGGIIDTIATGTMIPVDGAKGNTDNLLVALGQCTMGRNSGSQDRRRRYPDDDLELVQRPTDVSRGWR